MRFQPSRQQPRLHRRPPCPFPPLAGRAAPVPAPAVARSAPPVVGLGSSAIAAAGVTAPVAGDAATLPAGQVGDACVVNDGAHVSPHSPASTSPAVRSRTASS